ncbi:MAG: hypothetical protein GY906_24515 [bacterium]|nr:hypothetical protein [bacterium]
MNDDHLMNLDELNQGYYLFDNFAYLLLNRSSRNDPNQDFMYERPGEEITGPCKLANGTYNLLWDAVESIEELLP